MEYNNVYFTGTISSFGNLFWFLNQNKRVWLYLPQTLSKSRFSYILSLHDCCGHMAHFENGRLKRHFCRDIPCRCKSLMKPEEHYFKTLSEYDEDTQNHILSLTEICKSNPPCLSCLQCKECKTLAEKYGMYDVIELSNS